MTIVNMVIKLSGGIKEMEYIIENKSQRHLIKLGFRKTYDVSEKFTYIFELLNATLRGIIIVYPDTNKVEMDVLNANYTVYAPFYNRTYGNHKILMDMINKEFLKEFIKLGIKKK